MTDQSGQGTRRFPNGWPAHSGRSSRFVSRGIENWLAEHPDAQPKEACQPASCLTDTERHRHFDLVIVGSGYGASMAAHVMAGRQVRDRHTGQWRSARVAILERGNERLPGMFPAEFSDLFGEVRAQVGVAAGTASQLGIDALAVPTSGPAGMAQGLFDFKVGDAISGLVANGLGGGSLINAGVMLEPRDSVFRNGRWPSSLVDGRALAPFYRRARRLLGATVSTDSDVPNDVERVRARPAKQMTLAQLGAGGARFQSVPITVQLGDEPSGGVHQNACVACGDCATGCNHDSKRSLDVMLLAGAASRGVDIYTGVTVLRFQPHPGTGDSGWALFATHTDPVLRRRASAAFVITTDRLIVAAGSYGSTELLSRSAARAPDDSLRFSDELGSQFSGNGDMIVAVSDLPAPTQGVGDPALAPATRRVGPTITGMLDLRDAPQGIAVQELGIPATLHEVLAQTLGLVRLTSAIVDPRAAYAATSDGDTQVDQSTLDHSLVLAVMGEDGGLGHLSLPNEDGVADIDVGDGNMLAQWTKAPRTQHYEGALAWLREQSARNTPGARVHANPVWRPLGRARSMFGAAFEGPRITVHPLGGCPMADSVESGVVDDIGRVFRRAGGAGPGAGARTPASDLIDGAEEPAFHDGLAVLDGAILPGAVGINPALTIAAVSLRASEALASVWGLATPEEVRRNSGGVADLHAVKSGRDAKAPDPDELAQRRRPVFAAVSAHRKPPPRVPTLLALSERLIGDAVVMHAERPIHVVIELTLHSAPFDARKVMPGGARIPLQGLAGDPPDPNDPASPLAVPQQSRLRLFRRDEWLELHDPDASLAWRQRDPKGWQQSMDEFYNTPDQVLGKRALLSAPVSGHIDVLTERQIPAAWRLLRGASVWWASIGIRWIWQSISGRLMAIGVWLTGMDSAGDSSRRGAGQLQDQAGARADGQSASAIHLSASAKHLSASAFEESASSGYASAREAGAHVPTEAAGEPPRDPLLSAYKVLTEKLPTFFRALLHAGRQREMVYSLDVHQHSQARDDVWAALTGGNARIHGRKKVRFQFGGNTLRQLMRVHLEQFPGLFRAEPLRLDLGWLARQRTPLLRIVDEQSGPDGWADIAHFMGDVGRPVLLQSLFSFVAPDRPAIPKAPPQSNQHRLAWPLPELQCSEVISLTVCKAERKKSTRSSSSKAAWADDRRASSQSTQSLPTRTAAEGMEQPVSTSADFAPTESALPDSTPADSAPVDAAPASGPEKPWFRSPYTQAFLRSYACNIGRDRYPEKEKLPPVLLIHGYSASGTTWAHPALKPGLAASLAQRGRQVWVIDMRSSSGMVSATHPFSFEDIAFNDLPCAIAHIAGQHVTKQVDIVAHCMGAVMFSMMMLADAASIADPNARFPHERVRRIALSQAGPVMKFSAINVYRAYLMAALRYLLPIEQYQFTPSNPEAEAELMIDRLLAILPYPDDSEFLFENPPFRRTPFMRLRRRMDLLYGKAFTLPNLDRNVLDQIDHFFGPMSALTLTQSIGFARHDRIADQHGRPFEGLEAAMERQWKSPTLWVHGAQNGIFSPSSVLLAQRLFDKAGLTKQFESQVFPGLGHQDSLIGKNCLGVLERIGEFLDRS